MSASPINQIVKNGLVLVLATVGLAACGGNMDDLEQYIDQIKARPGTRYLRTSLMRKVCVHHLFRIRHKLLAQPPAVPAPIEIGVVSTSKAFRWIRLAWLERCISAKGNYF
jgi:hypothetical protein